MIRDRQSAPETILVVDDELSVLSAILCILERDYTVMVASCAEVALRMVEHHDVAIDLMITDVVMPDMSGRELAERSWAIRPNLRVLFMSGYTNADVAHVKMLKRVVGFLPKPFTSGDLRETVRKAINAPVHHSVAAGTDSFEFWRSLTTERS